MANETISEAIKDRILVIDGAMGTCLQNLDLTAEDFGGEELEGCNENLILTRPHIIEDIHYKYLQAGADIVETNTFGATPLVLDEYDLGSKCHEINYIGATLARNAVERFEKETGKHCFVAGSIGPTTKAISVTGGITFDELIENFYAQAKSLVEGGVDYLLLETCQDTRNIKAATIAINKLFSETNKKVPIAVSGTIEPMGTMLAGQGVDSLVTSLEHIELLYIGLNCATGPEFMTDHIRTLSEMAPCPVACVPNAGLPDEDGNYLETPQMMASTLKRFMNEGWINLIGGCCGTTYDHIKFFSDLVKGESPRSADPKDASRLSGIDMLEVDEDSRPILVGERTNVIGSRKFKRLISDGKYDEAAEIAKSQVKSGAQIIDVCLANPDRDELEDMVTFLDYVVKKIKVPLMIDSTDEKVIEESLKFSQGKAIINSINLEDGEERFEAVIPIAKKYGAALVVGTIDDDPNQGMGVSRERKLSIAERSYELLTKKYGVKPEDIYWDPLVFPCATGDENYVGSAVETIEGIKLIKEKYPKTKTVLGVSNVSFGLPTAGREVLNSVFVYHCTKAGLDMALVNTQHFKRFSTIPEEEVKLAEDLLFNRGDDPVAEFAKFYRGKKVETPNKEKLPLLERIPQYIIEGSKDGLTEDLDLVLKDMGALEIINGPLMGGMNVVGKLFNENKLIVAEVLQSAEAMKAAVNHLEPHMPKNAAMTKGKVVLATVKGDVHDIGKNLVEIVLANNGYEVVNLGIKITSEQLIEACRSHEPDILGLSGLLVKSAQQMVLSASDLAQAGIDVPILVGGAALSRNFVNKKISKEYEGPVIYAKDAMKGLDLANIIIDEPGFEKFKEDLFAEQKQAQDALEEKKKEVKVSTKRSDSIDILSEVPSPTDFNRHVLKTTPIDVVWKYMNPLMLFGRHLGVKGKIVRLMSEGKLDEVRAMEGGQKAIEIYEQVEEVKKLYKNDYFKPEGVYQFFKCKSHGNEITLYSEDEKHVLDTFKLPRQGKDNGLCLSDYVLPSDSKKFDNIAMFVVTVGKGVREKAEELKIAGNYLHSHIIAALALETAEAYAEYLHSKIRAFWGTPDAIEMTMLERFQAKYLGKRYSFGYPACPNLEDQEILFRILKPENDIGVSLTEGHMMDPESSVSAVVFHHPQATYFSVGGST